MKIHGYNEEKKGKGFSDIYTMAISFGLFLAVLLILGVNGIIFLVKLIIKNWMLVGGIVIGAILIKKFFFKGEKKI